MLDYIIKDDKDIAAKIVNKKHNAPPFNVPNI
jgi:hypothetical protein